ncbi:MAG: LuxR C-terminal-related transcriptional regulator [Candidatus Gastranaerophilales bacterium]|nr:LuxR C-terminal-related transcriptional regulator [Candidatus Gastranaerophilales bacterium]
MTKSTILDIMSYREFEIIGLIMSGYNYDKISAKLDIPRYQIKQYVKSINQKLNASNRIEAAAKVAKEIKNLNMYIEIKNSGIIK